MDILCHLGIINDAAHLGKLYGQQIEGRQLAAVRLGGCHGNLRPCPCIQHVVCLSGNGASHHIDNAQHPAALTLCQTKGCQRICGLAGLAHHDDQRLRCQDGIPVTELTGHVHFHRDACHALENIFCRHTCVASGTAGHNENLLDGPDILIAHAQLFDDDLVILDSGIQRICHSFRLLIDLF